MHYDTHLYGPKLLILPLWAERPHPYLGSDLGVFPSWLQVRLSRQQPRTMLSDQKYFLHAGAAQAFCDRLLDRKREGRLLLLREARALCGELSPCLRTVFKAFNAFQE
jgi:hypothetical protein